jgi:hypothetical protein
MTSRDFCYWLQGHFELGTSPEGMSCAQVEVVKKHLALVFIHEIDPSAGPPEHQKKLNEVHVTGPEPFSPFGPNMRC